MATASFIGSVRGAVVVPPQVPSMAHESDPSDAARETVLTDCARDESACRDILCSERSTEPHCAEDGDCSWLADGSRCDTPDHVCMRETTEQSCAENAWGIWLIEECVPAAQ